jgi:DNA-3-methyladenine glycosylase
MPPLSRAFYLRDTETVARDLLGRVLVRMLPGGVRLAGRIVETEAYLGIDDLACHTARGPRDGRAAAMWKEGGHAYVYLIYGMHRCMNVVTRTADHGEAVLIRALEPLDGLPSMRLRRPAARRDQELLSGPGKLCAALDIDKTHDGLDLTGGRTLWVEAGVPTLPEGILAAPRVGVDYAGDWAGRPLRFLVAGSPWVSQRAP